MMNRIVDCIVILFGTIIGVIVLLFTLFGRPEHEALARDPRSVSIRIIPYNNKYEVYRLQGRYIDFVDNSGMTVFENQDDGSKIRVKNATVIVEHPPKERF